MSKYELLIRNGFMVTEDGVEKKDIGVENGKIVEIADEISGDAKEVIDTQGLHVFPGTCDAHVHFCDPGRPELETFAHGSAAMVAGGGTSVLDMPFSSEPWTSDKESFDLKVQHANKDCLTDFGLWGSCIPQSIDKMEELAEVGVVGYKVFVNPSGCDGYPGLDDYTLYRAMKKGAEIGLPLCIHCENDPITLGLWNKAVSEGRVSFKDFNESRPAVTEIEAISRVCLFAEDTGCPVHIAHVSTARGIQIVHEARQRGVDVTAETTPYYLIFTAEEVEKIGAAAKSGLPPKDKKNRKEMWNHVLSGRVDYIASDHSPGVPKSGDNFFKVWGGTGGCQSVLSALLTDGFYDNGLPLDRIPVITVGNVADRYNLPGKGKIAVGYDADFAIVNMNKGYVLTPEMLFYKNKTAPLVNHKFKVTVERTIRRGTTMFCDGKIVSRSPGKLLKPVK